MTSQVFPSRATCAIRLRGPVRTHACTGGGASGVCRLFIAPRRCSGRVGCLKCPVSLFMPWERRHPPEIGFYTLFIVTLPQFDKERGSPGLHATPRLGRFYRAALESNARAALFMNNGSGFRSVAAGSEQCGAARRLTASVSLQTRCAIQAGT